MIELVRGNDGIKSETVADLSTFLRSGYDAGSFHFLSHIVVTCTERANVGSLLADAGDYAFTFGGGGGMAIQRKQL